MLVSIHIFIYTNVDGGRLINAPWRFGTFRQNFHYIMCSGWGGWGCRKVARLSFTLVVQKAGQSGIPSAHHQFKKKKHVSHNKNEFAKKVRSRKRPGVVVAGTQCVDRWQQSLEKALPQSLHVKDRPGGGIAEKLISYVWGFVWRSN